MSGKRPADLEGFFYACPSDAQEEGWHVASLAEHVCINCHRTVTGNNPIGRWKWDVRSDPYVIEEVPW